MKRESTLKIKNKVTGKSFKIASWRYWEIVDYLRTEGFERQESYDAALWATRAKYGDKYEFGNYILAIV